MDSLGQRVRFARLHAGLTQVQLADACGINQSNLSKLESGKNAETLYLPEIEKATGVSALWMRTGKGERFVLEHSAETIRIPQYDVAASMGTGLAIPEHIEVVRAITVSLPDLRKKTSFTRPDNLAFITAYGTSMEPTFSDGDVLLVDQGITEVKFDDVYVLERGDELFVKRIQRRYDGGLIMISDNKRYEPQVIPPEEMQNFRVRGRVVLVWNARTP